MGSRQGEAAIGELDGQAVAHERPGRRGGAFGIVGPAGRLGQRIGPDPTVPAQVLDETATTLTVGSLEPRLALRHARGPPRRIGVGAAGRTPGAIRRQRTIIADAGRDSCTRWPPDRAWPGSRASPPPSGTPASARCCTCCRLSGRPGPPGQHPRRVRCRRCRRRARRRSRGPRGRCKGPTPGRGEQRVEVVGERALRAPRRSAVAAACRARARR